MHSIIEKQDYRNNEQHLLYLESLKKCLENSLLNVFLVSKKGSLKKSVNSNLMDGKMHDKEALERINYNIALYKTINNGIR